MVRGGVGLLAGLVLWALLILFAASQLVMPPRRSIQDYHGSWLGDPGSHGIQIQEGRYLDGLVPCLLVTPWDGGISSHRGEIIRQQVAGLGHALGEFGEIHGTLVLLHGRKGRKEDLLPVAERFCAVGFRCLLPDLPGHGDSPVGAVFYGAAASEGEIASRLLREVADREGFLPGATGVWGMSMGGAFAVRTVSSAPEQWDCLVIVSSFDSLDEVIREQSDSRAGIFGAAFAGGIGWALRTFHGFDPELAAPAAWAEGIEVPVLVAHGTSDPLFPLERGLNLFRAMKSSQKKWVEVDGGNHDNVLVTEMPLYAGMASWFLEHMIGRAGG